VFVSASLVALVVAMLFVQAGEAIMCYQCTKLAGIQTNGNCPIPDNTTTQVTCNTSCISKFNNLGTTRDCSGSTTVQNGCSTVIGLYECDYTCTTNLCNTRPSSAPRATATLAPALLAFVALAIGLGGKLA